MMTQSQSFTVSTFQIISAKTRQSAGSLLSCKSTNSMPTEYCFFIYIYVVVNFLSQVIFMFFVVSTSLAYITIPKNKGNIKITWDKKLTTTYIYIHFQDPTFRIFFKI